MRKPDDDLKLDINEIFGAPESVPEPPLSDVSASLDVTMTEPSESEIKFNDLTNTPINEPVVLTVKSKHSSEFDFMMGSSDPTNEISDVPEAVPEKKAEEEGSSLILKPGTSGKSLDPKDFFLAYDYFREVFLQELKDSVGPKKTCVMLVKTFEAAREKHPEVFRNANWDASGNLMEDGSLNIQRVLDNKSALDQKQAEIILDTALTSLLNLRLQAVEKGLGADVSNRIKTRLKIWADEESRKGGYGKNNPQILRRLSNFLL